MRELLRREAERARLRELILEGMGSPVVAEDAEEHRDRLLRLVRAGSQWRG